MSIEIKEIVVRTIIDREAAQNKSENGDKKQAIPVSDTVEQVLEIIKKSKER
jgi:hypothetical protein